MNKKVGKTIGLKKISNRLTIVDRKSSRLPKLMLTLFIRPGGVDVFSNKHGGQAIGSGKTIKEAYRDAHKGWEQ